MRRFRFFGAVSFYKEIWTTFVASEVSWIDACLWCEAFTQQEWIKQYYQKSNIYLLLLLKHNMFFFSIEMEQTARFWEWTAFLLIFYQSSLILSEKWCVHISQNCCFFKKYIYISGKKWYYYLTKTKGDIMMSDTKIIEDINSKGNGLIKLFIRIFGNGWFTAPSFP